MRVRLKNKSSEPDGQLARCFALSALVDDLQSELNDARSEGAGDDAAGRWGGTLCARGTAGQIEVGVIEDVVELRTKLHLQPLHGGLEALVDGEIGLVERRSASGIARQS